MIQSFITMNGYGLFVWLSFAVTFLACAIIYYKTYKTLKKYEKDFAKELNELTGKKVKSISKKKKTIKEVDPSSGSLSNEKKLPDIYKPKEGLGFFGYIFLFIIIGFSIIGILKTFETDLMEYFPEMEYIFEILDEQLIYLSETVKNVITIINDLINSY